MRTGAASVAQAAADWRANVVVHAAGVPGFGAAGLDLAAADGAGAAGQPAGADAADAGAAAAAAAPAARAGGVRRLGAGPHRPARLQRLRRQQGGAARLCRGAAPRTGRHPGARADPRPAQHAHRLQRRRGRGLQPRHRHGDGHARDRGRRAAGADRERGRRVLRRLPRAPGRAPERPARRAHGRQLRQAPAQPASPRRFNPQPLEPRHEEDPAHPGPAAAGRLGRPGGRRRRRTAARLGGDPLPDPGRRAREALRVAQRQGPQGEPRPTPAAASR